MDPSSLINTLGLGALSIAALTYLARKAIEQVLSRDSANFQAKLSAEHDSAIEKLRHDLKLAALEREIRFSRLYEKKLEVLGELYRRMARAEKAFSDYANPMQLGGEEKKKRRQQEALTCGNAFFDYLNENDVYLESSLAKALFDIWTTFRRAWSDSLFTPQGVAWAKAWEEYQSKAFELRHSIRREVQDILEGRTKAEPNSSPSSPN